MTAKRGEPRRRYELAFKRQVVAETQAEGATVAAVARRHGLNANLVFNWRKDKRFNGAPSQGATQFLPVEIAPPPATGVVAVSGFPATNHHFDIEVGGKVRLRCREDISKEALSRVLSALRRFA
jgi:transposase